MSIRPIVALGLSMCAALSQAGLDFTVLKATTNGVGGLQTFPTFLSPASITGLVNRSAPAMPTALEFDLGVQFGRLQAFKCDLFFVPTLTGEVKGSMAQGETSAGPDYSGDQDFLFSPVPIGSNYNFSSINALGIPSQIGGITYTKVSVLCPTSTYSYRFHVLLDTQYRNATLAYVRISAIAVPEPAPVAALGLGTLVLLRRRNRRKA